MQKKQGQTGASQGKLPAKPVAKKPEPQHEKTTREQEPRTFAPNEIHSSEPAQTASVERPLGPQPLEPGGAPRVTTPAYPCLCPDEKYPITRSVCLGRQGRNFEKCLGCEHLIKERRPRKSDFKEK
jgi:hypothetical protein